MKAKANLHLVPGSEKTLPKGAKFIGKTKAEDRVEITVLLRARKPLPSLEELCGPNLQSLSHDQFRDEHGADPADIEKVETFAAEHGLSVSQTSRAQRTLRLSGTVAEMKAAFGVTLNNYQLGKARFRGRKGGIMVPKELAGIIEGVFDLDNRSQARANFHLWKKSKSGVSSADFPASSPFVLACGGTRLIESNGSIISETVWNNRDGWATGGGVSDVFPVPPYQANVNVPKSINPDGRKGRSVPDVAGDADGDTGYKIRVDGIHTSSGATSAVSPLWAALIALLNQGKRSNVGFLTPRLYQLPASSQALRDVTGGDNEAVPPGGGYSAAPGWDACTGLGSPNGSALLAGL